MIHDVSRPYTRRVTHVRAAQVTRQNAAEVALWCGGSLWGISVRVPDPERGFPRQADPTDWVVKQGDRRFVVMSETEFEREFVPQMSVYQPVPASSAPDSIEQTGADRG